MAGFGAVLAAVDGAWAPAFAVAVALSAVVGWRWATTRVARARAGVAGERVVSRALRGFGTVLYGWVPPGRRSDVDVVVVDPCVAAVEVKRASGRVRTRDDGTVLVGGSRLPGSPLRQAVGGAAAVRRALGTPVPVHAVLCITDMSQRPRVATSNGVPVVVCSVRHLRRVLRRLERTADGSRDDRLAALTSVD